MNPKSQYGSVATEAYRILDTKLLHNKSLQIPASIVDRLSTVSFTPADTPPIIPTPCKISESASALWALVGLFSAKIYEDRYGAGSQKVEVDVHQVTLFPFSAFLLEIGGKGMWDISLRDRTRHMDLGNFMEPYRALATNVYKARDGRFYHLHGGLNQTAILDMLGLPQTRPDLSAKDAVIIKEIYAKAIAQHDSRWLDLEANEFWRQAGTICYTAEEFRQTPHGNASANSPLYEIYNVQEDLPATAWPPAQAHKKKPLTGIKVLDLTRVIAGPTISKTLALLGADVLRISSKTVPEPSSIIFDMQIGKRDTSLNLKSKEGKLAFRTLVEEADVIIDGYRPGALERMGFGRKWVHEMARRRGKGIVYARENCYGWVGEWSHRSGWQQISDCVTGVSWEQGKFLGLDEPVVPLLPNSDYQTGVVGAVAILQALVQRAETGGDYNVDLSLNQFNLWYLGLGLHDAHTGLQLLDKHPNFKPRHDSEVFLLLDMTRRTCTEATGTEKGDLFDPDRWTNGEINWGIVGEKARYLDWTRFMTFQSASGEDDDLILSFDHGSCLPGSHEPTWSTVS
ncbi:hypothetical protein LTR84_010748 [Exophiala bonariae]|uniref:Uncharacterized protein n=1 Tax=Exophiala bonariae TaxID=1690606 RepID=A0AAV9MSW6_9EURO|nr:hypothetical protein LTR84_010748 [Exophiala bonariae]